MLFGAAVLAMVFGFASCKNEDDDPEGAISGSNNNYTVSYDNTNGYSADTSEDAKDSANTGVYRAWKRTSLKHLGALTKITLKKGSAAEGSGKNSGVMGFAWDLQTSTGTETENDATAETFNVVGVRNNAGTIQAYVSRFYNITDKQSNNFGATTALSLLTAYPSSATEYDVTKRHYNGTWVNIKTGATSDETEIWVDVTAKLTTSQASDQKGLAATLTAAAADPNWDVGAWAISFYTVDPTGANSTVTPVKTVVIPAASDTNIGSGYAATANADKKVTAIDKSGSQKKQAVYANIYKGHILNGAWNYADTYFLAEPVVEE